MEAYKDATLRINDDGSLVALWVDGLNCEEIILPASVLVGMGLFDETRPGFDTYEEDSEHAADILEMKLKLAGFAVEPSFNLYKQVILLCSPGPPLRRQPFIRIARIPEDS